MSKKVLWTWREACEALELSISQGPNIKGISIDSRTCQEGDLFVALKGNPGEELGRSMPLNRDGHDYIEHAIKAGAVGVLCQDSSDKSIPSLRVKNTWKALWEWAVKSRSRLKTPVIAITGSSGKTTAKSYFTEALGGFSSIGSLNNHLGVPISLLITPKNSKGAIFEIGTNNPGEISPLSSLVKPDVAVLLNVHEAHIGNFGTFEKLRHEKLTIFDSLSSGGKIVIEDSLSDFAPKEFETITFGTSSQADIQLCDVNNGSATVSIKGKKKVFALGEGKLTEGLVLASTLALLQILNMDLSRAEDLPVNLIPEGRGNLLNVGEITIVDDSYNANPETMRLAIQHLSKYKHRSIAVLGDMAELGENSTEYHRELSNFCKDIDKIICVGSDMTSLYNELKIEQKEGLFLEADETVIERLIQIARPGDRILVKGSNKVFWQKQFVGRLCSELV
tara:strand:+ start:645 stop:1994 length:1350 start_codon:yes stop_codon:yes gene_type:complete